METAQLASLSELLLVASDQAYAGNVIKPINGSPPVPLSPFRDGPANTDILPPYSVDASTFFVANTFQDETTGFKAIVYRSDPKRAIIVAMAGTDGSNVKDWWSNLTHYGWNQWESNQEEIFQFLDGQVLAMGGSGSEKPKIYFTGQSLGGALAEYAAYGFVANRRDYGSSNLALVTFNGLGGVAALREKVGSFNPSLIADFAHIAHYGSLNDLVWRLGGGHLGDKVYSFRGLNFSKLIPGTDEPFLLDTINAHRIETGYYYPLTVFQALGVSEFEVSVINGSLPLPAAESQYLRVDGLQKIVSILGNIFRQTDTSSAGAMFQMLFGGLGALVLADSEELNTLVREYVLTRQRAGMYEGKDEEYEAALETDWAMRLRIGGAALALSNVLSGPFGWILRVASGIALAPIYTLVEGLLKDDIQAVFQRFEAKQEGSPIPDSPWEETLERSSYVGAALNITEPGDLRLDNVANIVGDDVEAFAERMVSGSDWRYRTTEYLAKRGAELGKYEETQLALNEFWKYALHNAGDNSTLHASIWSDFDRFTTDWTSAVAKVNDKLIAPKDTPIDLAAPTQYAEKSGLWGSVLKGLEEVLDLFVTTAHAEEARASVLEAIEEVRAGAETVLVRAGRPGNPFDDPAFDPDAAASVSAGMQEGAIRTFTAYLPYEAGADGQRIELTLGGANVESLSVLVEDRKIDLGSDETFIVTIAEGQREASFSIAADGDLDAAGALTLSAQLLNNSGVATHQSDDEAVIELVADVEASPQTVREVRGDWAPKPYTDPMTGEIYYEYDILGTEWEDNRNNTERLPGLPNTTGYEDYDGKLDGSSGNDHIVTGDYEDWVQAYEGDDHITGSDLIGTIVYAGAGDDWVEAMGYTQYEEDYGEHELEGRTVRLGEDQIFGGPGNDRLYGDSEASVSSLYDPDVIASAHPGDWISGGSGDDKVYGGAGEDVLLGGIGADRLVGGAGMDVLLGDDDFGSAAPGNHWRVIHAIFGDTTPGFDEFEVGLFPVYNYYPLIPKPTDVDPQSHDPYVSYYRNGGGADVLFGGTGKDILIGQFGDDILYGGEDEDILAGWEGADEIHGGSGDDRIAGDFGRDEQPSQRTLVDNWLGIPGLVGAPSFDASQVDQVGDDLLDGGAGNDLIYGEGGEDIVLGGTGNDQLHGDATYLPESLHGDDLVEGGAGDDALYGHGGKDALFGGDGNDSLFGGKDDDRLEGNAGDDILQGEDGDDVVKGGSGEDDLSGGEGADDLHGGADQDSLAGGLGDDRLYGDGGGDQLQGGLDDDKLYGGSGSDALWGDEGDDELDGGTGADVLYGGEGDDTYVLGPGYGNDQIQDAVGTNRLRFAPGVAPHDLGAELDQESLWVRLTFGPRDSVTFHAAGISGIDFANGTAWTRAELVELLPAREAQASDEGDVLAGIPYLRNELTGGAGEDVLSGAGFRDVLAGAGGADALDGKGGSDRYVYGSQEVGVDAVSDSEAAARAYLEWYYGKRGIADWEERAEHGGMFRAGGTVAEYFETFDEASIFYPAQDISYVEPLSDVAPLIGRNDTEALHELEAAGIVDRDAVEFDAGISLEDLSLTITVLGTSADRNPEQPWHGGGLLSVRWAGAGFDVEVPDLQFGFRGSSWLEEGFDEGEEASAEGSWGTYDLGVGVEEFRFQDGSVYSLEDVLHSAAVVRVYDYVVERGSGDHTIGAYSYTGIVFGDDVSASDVRIERSQADLVLALDDFSATLLVEDWFTSPGAIPEVSLRFAGDVELGPEEVTRLALTQKGSAFDDFLSGTGPFPSFLFGGEGDDELRGGEGDDELWGEAGDDALYGGPGSDTYVYTLGDGNDYIGDGEGGQERDVDTLRLVGIAPEDIAVGRDDSDLHIMVDATGETIVIGEWVAQPDVARIERLEFDDGTAWTKAEIQARAEYIGEGVELIGTEGDDILVGFEGDDSVEGEGGDDRIEGLAGSDELLGGDGNDTLAGGPGNDFLDGGEGDDVYEYGTGGGRDDIYDESSGSFDVLRFDASLSPADVAVTQEFGALHLYIRGTGDRVMLGELSESEPGGIEQIEFADGTVWAAADLPARAELLPGTPFGDVLWGTGGDDTLGALGGDDVAYGNGGDDLLLGGAGDDYLEGGDGNDILRGGDGDDQLLDWEGGTSLMEGDSGDDYLYYENRAFVIGGADDDWIDNYGSGSVIAFDAGDGHDTVYAAESFTLSIGGAAPGDLSLGADGDDFVLWVGSEDSVRLTRQWEEDPSAWPQIRLQLFGSVHFYDFNAVLDAFMEAQDRDASLESFGLGDVLPSHELMVSEAQALGGSLAWQYGTTGTIADLTQEQILSILGNADFGTAPQPISAQEANRPPQLAHAIADQAAEEDKPFELVLPGDTFGDPDPEDALHYAAGELPPWLSFDAQTLTFSGTPGQAHVGTVTVTVTATDGDGSAVADDFILTVTNVNDPPSSAAQIPDQDAIQDLPFAFTVPQDSFADEDGEALAWLASRPGGSGLPGWLTFDAAARTFSGTPGNGDVGSLEVQVTATDATGASAASTFAITVLNVNDAPTLQEPLEGVAATEDQATVFTVPEGTFSDVDAGDTLSITAHGLPAWLSFDPATLTFSGTPLQQDVGSVSITVKATDAGGACVSDEFTLSVANVNDAPVAAEPIADQSATEDERFAFTAPEASFTDEDGEALAWFASRSDGTALPAWLAFDAATRSFAGTPENEDVGTVEVKVTVSDAAGAAVSDVFRLQVANVNDAPSVVNPLSDRAFVAGAPFSFVLPTDTFLDEDAGDALALSAGALPAWLAFDPATGLFTGNPGKRENGIWRVDVTATDLAGASVSDDFALVIEAKAGAAVAGGKGDDTLYGGEGSQALIAKGGNDALFGGGGSDLLHGGSGTDVLQGGTGGDILHGGSGQNLLDGGAGNDLIFGGRGSSLIAGGTGNDVIHTGPGHDVLLFNRGDGVDTIFGDRRGDNTLSFGGGIRYSDLELSRRGKDLIVSAGENDQVVLKGWYAGKRGVAKLQFITDSGEVETLDFRRLVRDFDRSSSAKNCGLTSWDITNALLQFHLANADDMALGGDLAYWYARNRGFAGISVAAAQDVIGAAGFGSEAQSLRPFSGLQEGFVKLS